MLVFAEDRKMEVALKLNTFFLPHTNVENVERLLPYQTSNLLITVTL